MDTITVDKTMLLDKLRENRLNHAATFREAIDAYRIKAIEVFEARITAVKAGKLPDRSFPLPLPEEHTADYDTAISALEWDQGATVELTLHEFRQYVEDNWGWQQSFLSNTTSYVQH